MYVNLMMTMVLGGLWHGANWTYIVWGLLHGGALAIHKVWMNITGSAKKQQAAFGNVISIALTFLFTSFCWIFFRADSLSHALMIIRRILQFESGLEQPYLWLFVGAVLLSVCSKAAWIRSKRSKAKAAKTNRSSVEGYYPILDLTRFWSLVAFFLFCGLTLCLAYTGGSPFIYGNY